MAFTVTLKLKENFFDRQKVIDALSRSERRYLSKGGAYVRTAARSSMRRRKRASSPGQPPSAHTGDLKRILFALELQRKATIIGPLGFNKATVPLVLEEGGVSQIKTLRRGRRLHTREVRIDARPYMGPALKNTLPKLAPLWRDTLNKGS